MKTKLFTFLGGFVPLVLLAALALAGCEVAASPTVPDSGLLKEPYVGNTDNRITSDALTEVFSNLESFSLSGGDSFDLQFCSTAPKNSVSLDTIRSAFEFRMLGADFAGDAVYDSNRPYTEGAAIPYTVETLPVYLGSGVRFTFAEGFHDSAGTSAYIQLRIKASALVDAYGRKPDLNNNLTPGEARDDYYANILTAGGGAASAASPVRNPRAYFSLSASLSAAAGPNASSVCFYYSTTYGDTARRLAGIRNAYLQSSVDQEHWTDLKHDWAEETSPFTAEIGKYYRILLKNCGSIESQYNDYGFTRKLEPESRGAYVYYPAARVISSIVSVPYLSADEGIYSVNAALLNSATAKVTVTLNSGYTFGDNDRAQAETPANWRWGTLIPVFAEVSGSGTVDLYFSFDSSTIIAISGALLLSPDVTVTYAESTQNFGDASNTPPEDPALVNWTAKSGDVTLTPWNKINVWTAPLTVTWLGSNSTYSSDPNDWFAFGVPSTGTYYLHAKWDDAVDFNVQYAVNATSFSLLYKFYSNNKVSGPINLSEGDIVYFRAAPYSSYSGGQFQLNMDTNAISKW
jgi:hypothetical protein